MAISLNVTTENIDGFIINRVKSREIFEYMIENGMVNENELYLVEDEDTSILYTAQTLTDSQKAQVITNISAVSKTEVIPVERGGTGRTSYVDSTPTTAKYRASSLKSTESNPTTNGVISWKYE